MSVFFILLISFFAAFAAPASAQDFPPFIVTTEPGAPIPTLTDDDLWDRSLSIHFPQNVARLPENTPALEFLCQTCHNIAANGMQLCRVVIVRGSASPEGTLQRNEQLARERAEVIAGYVSHCMPTEAADLNQLLDYRFVGEDYYGLRRLMEQSNWEHAARVIDAIDRGHGDPVLTKKLLRTLDNGEVWTLLNRQYFPDLRATRVVLVVSPIEFQPEEETVVEPEPEVPADTVVLDTVPQQSIYPLQIEDERHPFYMSLHSNLLYDSFALPNLGVEFYLGRNWSIMGNWHYAWWNSDNFHRYWRSYGGEIALRKWMGRVAKRKPLSGHHLGVFAQALLYDFEWEGTGYLSGAPKRNIFYKPTVGGSLEYGFALPVAKRLNIDFSLGVGYLQGQYYKYDPKDNHYVWRSTHMRHWFGPTKLEISLVWLIGHGNVNKKNDINEKGGLK